MAHIELEQIRKTWGEVVAVESMDLEIEDGEFVAVLGPSGCGKSTTLLMLAGIYAPTAGWLRFDGAVVNEVESRHRNVGIVFQSYALYPHMTVLANILFPLKFQGLSRHEARARAEAVAALVRIAERLERKPAALSGGQQQRVALARALVKRPQLLLLDEPLSNLDASLRLAMRSEIKRLQRRFRLTTILVTHDQLEATTMADRVVCMRAGRIEQVGTPEDLYARPRSLFVAAFIGAPPINLLEGRAAGGSLTIGAATLPLRGAAEGAVTLGLRPECLRFAAHGLAGRIEELEPMGREILYVVETELGRLGVLGGAEASRGAVGEAVRLDFKASDSLLFESRSGARIEGAHLEPPGA